MGTEITLELGGMTLDWSKNSRGSDHGMLFQPSDRKRMPSEQIDYEYYERTGEDPGPMEMCFCRPLKDTVARLELLGFTMEYVRAEYEACVEQKCEELAAIWEGEYRTATDLDPGLMRFEEFCTFATARPVHALNDTAVSGIDAESEKKIQGRFSDPQVLRRLPGFALHEWDAYSERSFFGNLIGFLHPYSALRVLAENAQNLDTNLLWQYGPLVDNGWAKEEEFAPGARRTQTFLVATEGSSDAHILKHAFQLLWREVADFFRFIDVTEGHPFSGAGNLVKFAEGLAKIDVHNQIVFLFDNDAEGFAAYRRVAGWTLPANMRAMLLPGLEEFRSFSARGPEGLSKADINRRAAGIECYLDLTHGKNMPPQVMWINYKKEIGAYHGTLENKEDYTRAFLKQTPETVSSGGYNAVKLRAVLDNLVTECSAIATANRMATE